VESVWEAPADCTVQRIIVCGLDKASCKVRCQLRKTEHLHPMAPCPCCREPGGAHAKRLGTTIVCLPKVALCTPIPLHLGK